MSYGKSKQEKSERLETKRNVPRPLFKKEKRKWWDKAGTCGGSGSAFFFFAFDGVKNQ
jgi:hypothetical protein